MCYVCLVGSSEDELRLRLRLSSVPGHARPSSGGAFALRLVVFGQGFGLGLGASYFIVVYNIRRGGSSSPPSGRRGRSQNQ